MAVSDVELKSGWPKVRAERTVRCILVKRREEQTCCRLFRILIDRRWVAAAFQDFLKC